VEAGTFRTLGGKLIAFRGEDKFGARWTTTLVPQSVKDTLESIFKANPLVTFYPEPKSRPRDLFNVAWKINEINFPYSDVVKAAGYSLDGEMTEV
jgi:hypothetical protein